MKIITFRLALGFIGFMLFFLLSCQTKGESTETKITPQFVEAINQYDHLYNFHNGFACVMKDGKYGLINTSGEEVIPPMYSRQEIKQKMDIKRASVNVGDCKVEEVLIKDYYLRFDGEPCAAFIDDDGNEIPDNDKYVIFTDGLGIVSKDGKYGYINVRGEEVIPFIFEHCEPFDKYGFAVVTINNKKAVINKKGEIQESLFDIQIPFEYEVIGAYNSDWAYVDEDEIAFNSYGNMIFSNGVVVVSKDGIDGYVDKYGNNTFSGKNYEIRKLRREQEKLREEIQEREEQNRLEREQEREKEREKELEIISSLHQLQNQAQGLIVEIDRLYRIVQRDGRLANSNTYFKLVDKFDELIKIKKKQIEIARQLNDPELVREYEAQYRKVDEAASLMKHGDNGRVKLGY